MVSFKSVCMGLPNESLATSRTSERAEAFSGCYSQMQTLLYVSNPFECHETRSANTLLFCRQYRLYDLTRISRSYNLNSLVAPQFQKVAVSCNDELRSVF
jgi:hypothetical protein